MQYFTYLWFDTNRKMFYVGVHEGTPDDGYISSSRWLTAEYHYRPQDFKRKILSFYESKALARKAEAKLLSLIKEEEFGSRYYNLKNGRKKGTPASNKGKPMSMEQREKLRLVKLGKPSVRKGVPNKPKIAD